MGSDADRSISRFFAVVELALRQHGVVSAEQAALVGVDRRGLHRAVAAGKLLRVFPSVYRVQGSEVTWESELMAAHLWLGSDSAVSHLAAAALWELPDFPRGPVELLTPRHRKALPPVVVREVRLAIRGHTTTVAHIPVTNAGRTLVDIAGLVLPDRLECAVEDALRRRLTSIAHLRWLCKGRYGKGAKGIGVLKKFIDDSKRPPTESPFETKLLQAIRKASLPVPVRQFEVTDRGRFVARVDFAYPWAKIAIEADSYKFHGGRNAWESGIDRRESIEALGWRVITVTYRQMESNMVGVAARIRAALMPGLGQP